MKKLLIVMNYWSGDADRASDVLRLIADLEPMRNEMADICLHRRNDAQKLPEEVKNHLLTKFAKVHEIKCRRVNCVGYPAGCNGMFYDLIELLRNPEWADNYYAFVNMESDVVPIKNGWIGALAREWNEFAGKSYLAIGHINEEPVRHLNGAAMYAMDLFNKAGGMSLLGGPETVAYDFYLAPRLLPVSKDTTHFYLDFNRKTITAEDLFGTRKFGQAPFLYHGVKDRSVLVAVRARYIDKNPVFKDMSGVTVLTYSPRTPEAGSEEEAILKIWEETWRAQGFNPIITTEYDARKNPLYTQLKGTITAYQSTGKINFEAMKWLALDYHGGGLYSDWTVIPGRGLSTDDIVRDSGVTVFQSKIVGGKEQPVPSLVYIDRNSIKILLDSIIGFDFGEKNKAKLLDDIWLAPSTKIKALVANIGAENRGQKLFNFSSEAMATYSAGSPKSSAMQRFMDTNFV